MTDPIRSAFVVKLSSHIGSYPINSPQPFYNTTLYALDKEPWRLTKKAHIFSSQLTSKAKTNIGTLVINILEGPSYDKCRFVHVKKTTVDLLDKQHIKHKE